jgi:8-oxo-dGTP pyrophosphatase MutT (NUDIX family)
MKTPAAWRTISSSVAFDGGWVKVRADHCVTAEGASVSPYYVVESPDFVHVAALTPGRGLVMVRQYRQGSGHAHLELPAGMIDPDDADAIAAARRELREETGFDAKDWRLLHVWHANPARMANRHHLVIATGATRIGDAATDGVESLTSGVLPLDDIRAAILDGRIDTTLHVASCLRVLLELAA